ncbi:hypothetical protein Agub_g137 [Astrephomene gubernaculifera]|uniref:DOMON domain-containing protein n=1 Tax=Astrephomene gubernaculifera TaxID=47775 RepID=A0AAD3HGF9_9CHLO|nr:hypothetical protein Agub_g137 [Astrephomene gubernaculifera]
MPPARLCFGWILLAALLSSPLIEASQCFSNFSPTKYPFCVQASPNVSLHWIVQDGSITWALDVDGAWDWVGVGLSEGGMLGADLAIATHDSQAGQWAAKDYWTQGFNAPQLDNQQDVTLVSVERQSYGAGSKGNTLVAMRRPLESCDQDGMDRAVLYDTRQIVVFAYGSGELGYHGTTNRGQYELVLMPNTSAATGSASSASVELQTLDLHMPNITVPPNETSYMCVNLALPSSSKFHVYRSEPLIRNAPLVHHFVAYACPGNQPPASQLGLPYDCTGENMQCEEFWMGWAPGVGAVDAPAEAALAFGPGSRGGDGNDLLYVALQIHYNNPEGLQGEVDSSGFRLLYSSVLKPYDMGVLTLGSYDIAVPPGAASWTTPTNICPGACTAQMMAGRTASSSKNGSSTAVPASMTLVESFYHMHKLGRRAVTRHVRNGVELPPLGSRQYFDFNYQAPVSLPPGSRQLLPGDVLLTSCTYSGEGRANTIKLGLGSEQEMCFNFLTYYPYNASVTNCIASSKYDVATCTTGEKLFGMQTKSDVEIGMQAGELVPLPSNVSYRPYNPTCVRSAAASAADSSNDDNATPDHHRRNVGGAVAAILLVTLLGAVAIVVVWRVMRKKKQEEEAQHLFEKYNPNSFTLPVVASTSATTTTAKASSDAAAVGGNSSSSQGQGQGQADGEGRGLVRISRPAGYTELSRTSEAV